ncbi:halocin C8 precursor-like protein [Staphylococcus agnetis]|uniref:halocin C8 precursor-like protein n=1 Tax=Staphylococcus agnetis TaxID=985762 RepID=UPI00211A39A6|nr:halocin C8 precursor-like protein [Staphylococcus agnetis]
MKKVVFSILSIVTLLSFCFSLGFQDVSAESKAVSKPTSNVDSKTKQEIINVIKKADVYKKHANSTSINLIKDENIIVHLDKGKNTNVYSVNFIFGKELSQKNNNLAMIELKYNEANKDIFYNHMMYSKFVKHNDKEFINMKGILNDKPYYEFNLDQKGHYYDQNFKISSKDKKVIESRYADLKHYVRSIRIISFKKLFTQLNFKKCLLFIIECERFFIWIGNVKYRSSS